MEQGMTLSWIKEIKFNNSTAEYYIEIEDIAIKLGWTPEDTLEWTINEDGTATLSKKKDETNE